MPTRPGPHPDAEPEPGRAQRQRHGVRGRVELPAEQAGELAEPGVPGRVVGQDAVEPRHQRRHAARREILDGQGGDGAAAEAEQPGQRRDRAARSGGLDLGPHHAQHELEQVAFEAGRVGRVEP